MSSKDSRLYLESEKEWDTRLWDHKKVFCKIDQIYFWKQWWGLGLECC